MIAHVESDVSLVYTPDELAVALQVSTRTLRRLEASGRLPMPVNVGRSVRWRRDEISAWLAAGAPKRREWEATRRAK
jgi:excisionase family DNA binding protein